jgi:hypothetical protein
MGGTIIVYILVVVSYYKRKLMSPALWASNAYLGFRQNFRLLDFE